jgi:hypothetical protein
MISILFGHTHDGELTVIAGPGDLGTVNDKFKELVNAGKENADYSQIFLHELTLTGGRKQFSFIKPADVEAAVPAAQPPEELSSEELPEQMTTEDKKQETEA